MTNREWLQNMATYDKIMKFVVPLHVCPRSFFGDKKKDTSYCLKIKCSACLQEWLNEERK